MIKQTSFETRTIIYTSPWKVLAMRMVWNGREGSKDGECGNSRGGENPGQSACWESVSVRAPRQPVTESSYCSWSAGEERQEAGERNRKEGEWEGEHGVGGRVRVCYWWREGRWLERKKGGSEGEGGGWGMKSVPGSQLQASPVVLGRGVREGWGWGRRKRMERRRRMGRGRGPTITPQTVK